MKRDTIEDHFQRMNRVLLHIQEHLDEPISLEELARVACFSPYHFHRIFRGMVGESVAAHVRRLRLERAATRLWTSKRGITRIAFEAGFESHEAFSRAFKRQFGCSPSAFRKTHRHPLRHPMGGLAPKETKMKAEIKNRKEELVAFVRHIGPYREVGKAWETLCQWAGPKGLLGPHTSFLGLSYDDPEVTPEEKLRYDACIPITGDHQAAGEVGIRKLPAGRYAVAMHKGPYERLSETYAAVCGEWLPKGKEEARNAPSIEVYLNDAKTTPPEELLVEIWMPIE